ncbi:MAG: hypothetical protein ACLPN1_11685 [Dissulfurispiraceae bacterium]
MRITTQAIYSQYNANIQNLMNSLDQTEEQIGTGLKLNEPSDNPAVVAEITTEKAQLSSIAGYQSACTNATTLLNATNTALGSLSTLISSAQGIGNGAASASTQEQTTDVSELKNIIQSTIGVANTQIGNTYIFSGYGTNNPAVNADGTLSATATADNISMQINAGTSVNVNVAAAGFISSAAPLGDTTIIGAMSSLETAIQGNDQAGIQNALTALNNFSTSVLSTQSDVGSRLGMITQASQNLTSQDTDVTNTLSGQLTLSSTDLAALSAEQQQQQTSLQSLESISSSFLNTNLFDFLFPSSRS